MRFNRVIILGVLLLVSCGKQAPVVATLPSTEVLQRASQATRNLRSAEFSLVGSFSVDSKSISTKGTLKSDGLLTDAGKQLQFFTEFSGLVSDPSSSEVAVDGALEVVVMDKDEVYLNMHSLGIQPQTVLISQSLLNAFIGKWWLISGDPSTPKLADTTPDPALLRAQAEVVTVTEDKGAELIDGSPAYHYVVKVDPVKLADYMAALAESSGKKFDAKSVQYQLKGVQATGELWIDASSFHMKKAMWMFQDVALSSVPGGKLSATFTVNLHSQNVDLEISPPEGAVRFDPAMLLRSGLSPEEQTNLIPQALDADDVQLPFYPDLPL